jgi:hypothetical protein
MCGAAALAMVYRSFGQDVPQSEIWPRIAKRNNLGSLASATYLMAQDAIRRGFTAVAIQAKHPLQALRVCRDAGIRAILAHRLREDLGAGHYTVLLDIDAENVTLHDPYYGPSRRISNAALLDLWRPGFPNSEITGHMLIGIANKPMPLPACTECGTAMPATVQCAACARPISLEPAAVLGCAGAGCVARLWNHLCCPECDYTWSFNVQSPDDAAMSTASESSVDLARLFGELDKFRQHVERSSQAVDPQVREQMATMMATREKLSLVQKEQIAYRRAENARLAQLKLKYKQEEAAISKKREDISKPGLPLDGNALGQALLQSLGLLVQ